MGNQKTSHDGSWCYVKPKLQPKAPDIATWEEVVARSQFSSGSVKIGWSEKQNKLEPYEKLGFPFFLVHTKQWRALIGSVSKSKRKPHRCTQTGLPTWIMRVNWKILSCESFWSSPSRREINSCFSYNMSLCSRVLKLNEMFSFHWWNSVGYLMSQTQLLKATIWVFRILRFRPRLRGNCLVDIDLE